MGFRDADLELTTITQAKKQWFAPKPHLDYKSGPMCSMPPTIDPKNWTPVTSEELKAHQERLSIRGRLRRQFWMRAYHPEYCKYFSEINSDKNAIRFSRLKTVWHIKDTVKITGQIPQKTFALVILPAALYLLASLKFVKSDERTIFDRIK